MAMAPLLHSVSSAVRWPEQLLHRHHRRWAITQRRRLYAPPFCSVAPAPVYSYAPPPAAYYGPVPYYRPGYYFNGY